MPVQPFGKADPYYDALRVLSNQNLQAAALGDITNIGGGLENKIYLWHSDGSTIDTFDPTQAGLVAALAGAVSSDTVWLPSIPISCTAAVTVPAGVTLTGISHDSILTFTGFAPAAIVLSAGSIMENFTLNHDDGIGFDASAESAIALNMIVTADQPATVGIDLVVDELWMLITGASENVIVWSNYTHNGARIWSKTATMPAGVPLGFAVADDGSLIYVKTNTNTYTIYKCANPKAVSPTWTSILTNGDTAIGGGNTVTNIDQMLIANGTTLVAAATQYNQTPTWCYGEYNGSTWTWYNEGNVNIFGPPRVGLDSWAAPDVTLYDSAHATIETLSAPYNFSQDIRAYVWHRTGQPRYYIVANSSTNHTYIRKATVGNTDLGAVTTFTSQIERTHVRGAHGGIQVYVVADVDGDVGSLWLSDDGTTFTRLTAWSRGWIEDDIETGGGYLIWFADDFLSTGTIARQYDRAGVLLDDLTGNFWSLVTAENKTVINVGIVYV